MDGKGKVGRNIQPSSLAEAAVPCATQVVWAAMLGRKKGVAEAVAERKETKIVEILASILAIGCLSRGSL